MRFNPAAAENISASVKIALTDFQSSLENLARAYLPEAIKLGMKAAAEITRKGILLPTREQISFINGELDQEMKYISNWVADVKAAMDRTLRGEYANMLEIRQALDRAAGSQYYRAGRFGTAFWRESHRGMNREMMAQADAILKEKTGERIEGNFTAFPEMDVIESSCEGCIEAVAGNPYSPDNMPSPGDFECDGNCRHYSSFKLIQPGEKGDSGE